MKIQLDSAPPQVQCSSSGEEPNSNHCAPPQSSAAVLVKNQIPTTTQTLCTTTKQCSSSGEEPNSNHHPTTVHHHKAVQQFW
jgi:hypothetical protein